MTLFPWNPGVWLAQNWTYILGWAGAAVFLQRIYSFVSKILALRDDIITLKLDVVTIRDNHLPHIQAELETMNTTLTGLRDDVKGGFTRLADTMNVVLVRLQ
jgi:hypothetical protein